MEFENVKKISPLPFEHQGNMDDWLILEKIEDVIEGTSIPYNYKNSKFWTSGSITDSPEITAQNVVIFSRLLKVIANYALSLAQKS